MSKKVLITGASGFVGGFLVEECLNRNFEVYAGIRATSSKAYLQDPRINFLNTNLNDTDSLAAQFKEHRFDYVIHNAGLTKAPKKEDYFKVNCQFTKNVIKALQQSHLPEKFVYMSSLASYGPADNMPGECVEESDQPHPITSYGESKLASEKFIAEQSDLPYMIFRPTAVYGPREQELFTFFKIVNKGLETSIGNFEQKLSFIYVKDLATAVVDSCEAIVAQKAYFITDGKAYSSTQLGQFAKTHLGDKKTISIKIPVGIVRTIAGISEFVGNLRGISPMLNREKVRELESRNWQCNIKPLEQDLNFQPKYYLNEGLKETIEWYKEHKWL